MDQITSDLKTFIVGNFLFGKEGSGLGHDQSFLESGIIDSTGMLELVSFVEERYGISIGDRELVPENLDSLKNLSQFIARKVEAISSGR